MNGHFLIIGRSKSLQGKITKLEGVTKTLIIEQTKLQNAETSLRYDRIISIPKNANVDEWLSAAEYANKIQKVSHVLTFVEDNEYITAKIAKKLGLKYHSFEVVEATHEKNVMRNKLSMSKIEEVKAVLLNKLFAEKELYDACNFLYPDTFKGAVLKPNNARASLGIFKIKSLEQVPLVYKNYMKVARDYEAIVEIELKGSEYSVEAFSEDGVHKIIGITEKIKDDETCVELGHIFPAELSFELRNMISEHVKKILSCLGVENGPTHTELILTENGPAIVETHLRFAGDSIVDLMNFYFNVDFDDFWLRQFIGEKVLKNVPTYEEKKNIKTFSVFFFNPKVSGYLKAYPDISEEIKISNKIVRFEKLKQKNEFVSCKPLSSHERVLEIIITGDNRSTVLESVKKLTPFIQFDIDEGDKIV